MVSEEVSRGTSNFVSFEKWKSLCVLKRDQSTYSSSKYISIGEYVFQSSQNQSIYDDPSAIINQFNKYGSLAFSSASGTCFNLFGMVRGRGDLCQSV